MTSKKMDPFFRLELSARSIVCQPELEEYMDDNYRRDASPRVIDSFPCVAWKIVNFDSLVESLRHFQESGEISYRLVNDLTSEVLIEVNSTQPQSS